MDAGLPELFVGTGQLRLRADPDEVMPGMLRDQSGLWQWAEG